MPGENIVKTKGKIELADCIAAMRLHLSKRRIFVIVYDICCLLILTGILTRSDNENMMFIILFLIIYGIIVNFRFWVLLPRSEKKHYFQYQAIQKNIEEEITNEFLLCKNEDGQNKTKWAEFHKWKENKKLFLVYITNRLYILFPKRFFEKSEDINTFREILQKNIGKKCF